MSVVVRILLGFIAGALAVLMFHQPTIWGLTQLGLASGAVYQMTPNPWGVPTIANQCFWGGMWGVLFVLLWDRQGWDARGSLMGLFFGISAGLIAWGALHLAFGDIRAVAIALVFGVTIAAFILLLGPEVLFGMVFGVMGPAMVNWVVLPLIRGQALFGGGAGGAIARTALIGAMFGLGLAVLLSLLEKIGARRA
ncbi:hypothetical protein [Phreatobacter sp.]|uniref:hypothetical protein n=1 Tax=Phreatobacter sp. TaxID=1966341 RepID=UPI003F72B878